MTVLDRPTKAAPREAKRSVGAPREAKRSVGYAPEKLAEGDALPSEQELRCVVCHLPFDFAAGQTATVLKHIAYGYDFAHPGICEATAREWIFAEPGYDRPAFSTDGQRACVLRISSATGWAAVLPAAPEQVLNGVPVVYEPVAYWALVEYRDGSRHLEGVMRSPELTNEPGGAEFPEARRGRYASLGYVERMDF